MKECDYKRNKFKLECYYDEKNFEPNLKTVKIQGKIYLKRPNLQQKKKARNKKVLMESHDETKTLYRQNNVILVDKTMFAIG